MDYCSLVTNMIAQCGHYFLPLLGLRMDHNKTSAQFYFELKNNFES